MEGWRVGGLECEGQRILVRAPARSVSSPGDTNASIAPMDRKGPTGTLVWPAAARLPPLPGIEFPAGDINPQTPESKILPVSENRKRLYRQTSVKAGFLAIEKRRSNSVEICSVR
jgi:hypothetical protein